MPETSTGAAGPEVRVTRQEGGFILSAALPCPVQEARALAVIAALWALEAAGPGAELLWPNRVMRGGEELCAVTCRVTAAGELIFTFTPAAALSAESEALEAGAAAAARRDLAGYPENRAQLLDAYCRHCLTVMRHVNTAYRGVPVYGFAFAVDRHGGLMVMTQPSRTVVTLYGGEVTVAPTEGA